MAPELSLDTEIASRLHAPEEEIVRVPDALTELGQVDERLVRVVEMRYFGGLTEEEIGAALGVTERTVRRDWEKARLLLAIRTGGDMHTARGPALVTVAVAALPLIAAVVLTFT